MSPVTPSPPAPRPAPATGSSGLVGSSGRPAPSGRPGPQPRRGRGGAHFAGGRSSGRSRPPQPADYAALALVAVLAAAVGLAFEQVFPGADLWVLSVGPAVAGVAASTVFTGILGWRGLESALAAVGVSVVVVTTVTWSAPPSPARVAETLEALRDAPTALLTTARPAPDQPELLVLVAAVTWVVAHLGAELLLRTRGSLGPLAVTAAGLVTTALLAGAGRPDPSLELVAVLAVAAGAYLLARGRLDTEVSPRRRPRRGTAGEPAVAPAASPGGPRPGRAVRSHQRRRLALAVPLLALAALVPTAFGDQLPGAASTPRYDLPDDPVGDRWELRNPLVEVSVQRDADQTVQLFTAEAPDGIELWRQATLDRFDGAQWSSSGRFSQVGSQLPQPREDEEGDGAPPVVPTPMERVRQEVTVTGLDGPFLPVAVGRPSEVHEGHGFDDLDLAFDVNGATLQAVHEEGGPWRASESSDVAGSGSGSGSDSDSGSADAEEPVLGYRADSLVVEVTEADLDRARRDRSGDDAETATEAVPDAADLASVAMEQVGLRRDGLTGSTDIRELRALQDFFADQGRFRLAPEAGGGLTLGHLSAFVQEAVDGGPSEGTVEQYATAYAVMARTLGYPTRVAVGYRTPAGAVDGQYEVTNRDAFAWAEVKLVGLGWVPFLAGPVRTEDEPEPIEQPQTTTTLADSEDGGGAPVDPPEVTETDDEATSGSGLPWLPLVGGLAGVALAVLVAGPPLVRAVRRWRRTRHRDPAGQVSAAWQHLLDRLAAHRVPVTPAMTTTEVLAIVEEYYGQYPPPEARSLASLTNRSQFAPAAPAADSGAVSWRGTRQVLAWARRNATWADRLRAWFAVRPLRRPGSPDETRAAGAVGTPPQ